MKKIKITMNILFIILIGGPSQQSMAQTVSQIFLVTDPNVKPLTSVTCLKMQSDETVILYAIGADSKGNRIEIAKGITIQWGTNPEIELKVLSDNSASVKLAKSLRVTAVQLKAFVDIPDATDPKKTNYLTQVVHVSQPIKELPAPVFIPVLMEDPINDKTIGMGTIKVGESRILYFRGMDSESKIFVMPADVKISWKGIGAGGEVKVVPFGCDAAKVELVKASPYGMGPSVRVDIEFKDGKTKEAAFNFEVK